MHVSGRVRAGLMGIPLTLALLAGALVGKMTQTGAGAASGAALPKEPVPVLMPVAAGPQPPAGSFVAGFLPPDPAAQAAKARAAMQANPDQFPNPPASAGATPSASATAPGHVAGYADGSGYFHGTPRGQIQPHGISGYVPILTDVCASDSPPPGCHGVPATIRPFTLRLFTFAHDPIALRQSPADCPTLALTGNEFVIEMLTTNLGSFTVRYRLAGSGAAYTEVTGSSPDSWRSVLAADPTRRVVTCFRGFRPAPGDQRLEVDVSGVGVDGSGTDHFTGTISLPASGSQTGIQRRDGRPLVTVQALTSSTLQVSVPVAQHETAKVSLVANASGSVEPCLNPDPAAVTNATQPSSVRHADQGGSSQAWTNSVFRVTAPAPGDYAVCVSWFDNGLPPRKIEQADVPVHIASTASGQVLLAGYQMAHGVQQQPSAINVTISSDTGAACAAPTITRDQYVTATDHNHAATVCSFDGAPGYLGVQVSSDFGSAAPLVSRALLGIPECASATACTQWWTMIVHGPDHATDGVVVIGISVPGPLSDATVGVEHPVLTDRPEVYGARLLDGGVTVRVSPDDPRTILATWHSDQPARVIATADAEYAPDCPRKVSARNSQLATSAQVSISGLCPGVRYDIGFDLFDGSGNRTIYSLDPTVTGASIVYRAWPVNTNLSPVSLDYQLSFQLTHNGRPLTIGMVPDELSLQFLTDWNHNTGYRFAQPYAGSPWIGMSCAQARHYDRSKRGLSLSISGGSLIPVDATFAFSLYWPSHRGIFDSGSGPRCPSLYNQVNHTPTTTGTSWDCDFVIGGLHPAGDSNSLYSMLQGEPATFTGSALCSTNPQIQLTATLTVTLRPAGRTLHGHL